MKRTWSVLAMAGVMVALFCLAGALGGCASCNRLLCRETPYWQVVLTDVEGCWVSDYIAEGTVVQTYSGTCFRAVQRRTFCPVTLTYKYPLGREIKLQGSNIIVTPVCKPLWLRESDRYLPPPNQCAQIGLPCGNGAGPRKNR